LRAVRAIRVRNGILVQPAHGEGTYNPLSKALHGCDRRAVSAALSRTIDEVVEMNEGRAVIGAEGRVGSWQ